MIRFSRRIIAGAFGFAFAWPVAFAQEASFSDVPTNHPVFQAVEDLKTRGVLGGYSDGTFRPDAQVSRAEAVKIIASPLLLEEDLTGITSTPYLDVPADAWFLGVVEMARERLNMIDGPPQTTVFHPTDPVTKAAFLKMLLLANNIDPAAAYSEIKLPLGSDVMRNDEWYYPHMRYALSASMLAADDEGQLLPGLTLTRGDSALLLHRFLLYREAKRGTALLALTDTDIAKTDELLAKNLPRAEEASGRSILYARGVLQLSPEDDRAKAAVKLAEGFQALVRARKAIADGRHQDAIDLSGVAWHLGSRAIGFSGEVMEMSTLLQERATAIADEARGLLRG